MRRSTSTCLLLAIGLLGLSAAGCGQRADPAIQGVEDATPRSPDGIAGDVSPLEEVTAESLTDGLGPPETPPWCAPVSPDATEARARIFGGGSPDHPVAVIRLGLSPEGIAALGVEPRTWTEGTLSYEDEAEVWGPMPVAIRLKGGGQGDPEDGSFQPLSGKPAFKVDLNRIQGCGHLHGLTKLTLNNMVQDPTMIREWMGYRHLREAGVIAPRSAHVRVFLNDELLGLYAHIETYDQRVWVDERFPSTHQLFEEHLGSDLRPDDIETMDQDRGPEDDRELLQAVAQALVDPGEDLETSTGELIEWEATRRFLVGEKILGHRDGYSSSAHNVFFHLDTEGQLTPLPWGLDQSQDLQGAGYHQGKGLLHLRCMNDSSCRQAFDQEVVRQLPLVEAWEETATARLQVLEPYIAADPRAPWTAEERQVAMDRRAVFRLKVAAASTAAVTCHEAPSTDQDGDGVPCASDCDDGSADTYPGAPELCADDWQDEDCDGLFDEGCPESK